MLKLVRQSVNTSLNKDLWILGGSMGVGRNPYTYNTQSLLIRISQSSWGDNKQKITIYGQEL